MGQDWKKELLQPFVQGTVDTLKVQAQLEVKPLDPFEKGTREQPSFQIAGIIGLTSAQFTGAATLCFPEATFLKIMSSMLGEEFKEITDDLQDGAAELLNMIFGQVKTRLNADKGYQLQKAIPTIVTGRTIHTPLLSHSPAVVLPFETSAGTIHLEVTAGDATA